MGERDPGNYFRIAVRPQCSPLNVVLGANAGPADDKIEVKMVNPLLTYEAVDSPSN